MEGQVRIIDPTGLVGSHLRTAMDARQIAARRAEQSRRAMANVPAAVRDLAATGAIKRSRWRWVRFPICDSKSARQNRMFRRRRRGFRKKGPGLPHVALVVIHPNAVMLGDGELRYGTYDLFVPPNLDDRVDVEIQQTLREALINARGEAQSFNREKINAIIQVPRARSVTVFQGDERQTVRGFNIALPIAVAAPVVHWRHDRRASAPYLYC